MSRLLCHRWITVPLLFGSLSAHAIPPPPPPPPQIREARMTVTVRLFEARHGQVNKVTDLCKVSGRIPVYADDGSAAGANGRELPGCTMPWKGRRLNVSVRGAVAVARGPVTVAIAGVRVVPPDAKPLCPGICGPQALAESNGEVRIGGAPRFFKFSLSPNPVSILPARPTVWLDAEVEIAD
jgi:hypothetical protein